MQCEIKVEHVSIYMCQQMVGLYFMNILRFTSTKSLALTCEDVRAF